MIRFINNNTVYVGIKTKIYFQKTIFNSYYNSNKPTTFIFDVEQVCYWNIKLNYNIKWI